MTVRFLLSNATSDKVFLVGRVTGIIESNDD